MIRRRLTIVVVLLVATIGGLVGVAFLKAFESRLVAEVDRELAAVPDEVTRLRATRLEERAERTFVPSDVRRAAYVMLDPQGAVVWAEPSGTTDAPDPLPHVNNLPAPGGPRTVGSNPGGGPRYRIVTSSLPSGGTFVTAISLADVERSVSNARRVLIVAGLVALAATATATWWAIRRGLRPIDRMVDTAEAIAGGNLGERVEVPNPGDEVGRLGGALNVMLDRIAAALSARTESEQRMRRFVADASHELRTPLTAIRGYAELYRRDPDDPDAVRTAMERVEQAAIRMGVLVDDLVLLARLDQGRPLASAPVDLAALVAEAVADARAAEPGRAVHLDLSAAGASDRPPGEVDAEVTGDPGRLRQAVDNVLANVREHTPPGTPVTVSVAARTADVVVVVADEGPGMPPEDAARAFDRFWQAAPTGEQPRRGTGLGLAIVADLVAAHGGDARLDTAPGAGTRVTIRLPRAGAGALDPAGTASQVIPRST